MVKEGQTDKNGNIIYLYATDKQAQYSFIAEAQERGYDVLEMDGQLDNHFISWFESKNQGTRFARVDADVIDKLIEKETKRKMALTTVQQDLLRPVFDAQLPKDDKIHFNVVFEPLDEKQQPVVITQNEFMRRMKDMAAMGGGGMPFYGQMPDSYSVVVNGNHPLVAEILDEVEKGYGADELKGINKKIDTATTDENNLNELLKDKKEEEIAQAEKDKRTELSKKLDELRKERTARLEELGRGNKLVGQLIDLALLAGGMLKGESLNKFIRRSVEMIEK